MTRKLILGVFEKVDKKCYKTFAFKIKELIFFSEYIQWYLDDEHIGTVRPNVSFWKLGEFDKNNGTENIWKNGTDFAPFDQEVSYINANRYYSFILIFIYFSGFSFTS